MVAKIGFKGGEIKGFGDGIFEMAGDRHAIDGDHGSGSGVEGNVR